MHQAMHHAGDHDTDPQEPPNEPGNYHRPVKLQLGRAPQATPVPVGFEKQMSAGVEDGLAESGVDRMAEGSAEAGTDRQTQNDAWQQSGLRPSDAEAGHQQT